MSAEVSVVSFNRPLDPVLHDDIKRRHLHEGQILASGYLSVIKPEFAEVYWYGISNTARGVLERTTLANNRYNELPHNFGLLELTGIETDEVKTVAFIPFVPRHALHLFDNPETAAANFHVNFIQDVNRSLAVQQTPFRLATIAVQSA